KLKPYKNVTVKMTRTTDTFLSLTQRTNIANSWGADIFVSIHINSGGGTGFESFIYNGNVSSNTRKLQTDIHSAIMSQIDVKDRGKKTANFAVVRQSTMPSILTENLFIDGDNSKLKDSDMLDKLAEGHAKGILNYFGIKSKGGSSSSSSTTSTTKPKPSKPKPKSKWNAVSSKWTGQNLRKNDKGGAVKQLQKLVGVTADGMFGNNTEKAVKSAQRKHGLSVDGIAGKATYSALKGYNTKHSVDIDGKFGKGTVRAVQKALGVTADGVFSNQNRNSVTRSFYSGISYGKGSSPAVKALQKKVGVKQDGLLGPATVRGLQRYLGTPVDGKLSRPSSTVVKELQRRLNKGTF